MAEKLGRTVAELRATLDQGEFVRWSRFHALKAQRQQLDQLVAESRIKRG